MLSHIPSLNQLPERESPNPYPDGVFRYGSSLTTSVMNELIADGHYCILVYLPRPMILWHNSPSQPVLR